MNSDTNKNDIGKSSTTCPFCSAKFVISKLLEGKNVNCINCNREFTVKTSRIISESDKFFMWLALYYGIINEEILEMSFSIFVQMNLSENNLSISELMKEKGFIDDKDYEMLLNVSKNWDIRKKEKEILSIAVARNVLTKKQAREILIDQAVNFRKFGKITYACDLMKEKGIANEKQIAELISDKKAPEDIKEIYYAKDNTKNIKEANSVKLTEMEQKKLFIPNSKCEDIKIQTNKINEINEIKQPSPKEKETSEILNKNLSILPTENTGDKMEALKHPAINNIIEKDHDTNKDGVKSNDLDIQNYDIRIVSGIEITISESRLDAWLRKIHPDMVKNFTLEELKEIINNEGLVNGVVDDSLLTGFITSKIFEEKKFRVAKGKKPFYGKNGNIKYFFKTDYLTIGSISEDGNIDFKDRGEIPFIKEGTLMAEITPEVKSENGIDVFGMPIMVPKVTEIKVFCEKGAKFSDDRLKIFASTDGQPRLDFGNKLSVLSELKISGDVGYETGHVEFEGNIIISGTIQDGFRVSGANITAKEILGAEIFASGDLKVGNGINGAKIVTQGNVEAKFISKADITSYGHIIAEKQIIDTTITNSGSCRVKNGKIISCEISALQGIEAMEIGSDLSSPCRLKVGADDHFSNEKSILDDEIDELKNQIKELKEKEESLSLEDKEVYKMIADFAYIQDTSQSKIRDTQSQLDIEMNGGKNEKIIKELKDMIITFEKEARDVDDNLNNAFDNQDIIKENIQKTKDSILSLQDDIWILRQKKKDISALAKKIPHFPVVKAKGTIYSGTIVNGPNSFIVVKETIKNSIIKEVRLGENDDNWIMRIG